MDRTGKFDLSELIEDEPMTASVVNWLRRNGCEPATLVADALHGLRDRKAFLDRRRRTRYARRPIYGAFFFLWARKHRGKQVQPDDQPGELVPADELREFNLALIGMADGRAFDKLMPRMMRKRHGRTLGVALGSAEEFTCYVSEKSVDLADIFLKNFKTDRQHPQRAAIGYLETVAVSRYLHRESYRSQDQSQVIRYLRGPNRLDERTRLATKLVELPVLLTFDETEVLRHRYGFDGSFMARHKVKDVAERLGYPSAAVLSRKLYRVRKWAEAKPLPATAASSDRKEDAADA